MKRTIYAYGVDEPTLELEIDTEVRPMNFQQPIVQNTSQEDAHRQELMRRRLEDPDVKKQFRRAYAFKVGADYATLKPFCEDIVMAVDGFVDHTDVVRAKLELALSEYDSDKDVIVVVGRAIDNILVGLIVAEKVRQKPIARQSFAIAVYYGFAYRFYEVYLDPTIETHRIEIK